MQNLTKLISEARKKSKTDQDILNLIREYLQVMILKAIYQSKYGKSLSFMGGTCLRICYDLKRFSEDLDFALDRKGKKYSFKELSEIIVNFLKNSDFEVDVKVSEDKMVQKAFIRVEKVLHVFGFSPMKSQKIHSQSINFWFLNALAVMDWVIFSICPPDPILFYSPLPLEFCMSM